MGINLQQEWAYISGAPVVFAGAVLLTGFAIWAFVHFLYKAKIGRLEQDVRSEQGEIARLRSRTYEYEQKTGGTPDEVMARIASLQEQVEALASRPSAGAPIHSAEIEAPEDPNLTPAQRLLRRANALVREVGAALVQGAPTGTSERASAKIVALLLSMAKEFGINDPKRELHWAYERVRHDLQMLEQILPLLEEGHVNEAIGISDEFAARWASRIEPVDPWPY